MNSALYCDFMGREAHLWENHEYTGALLSNQRHYVWKGYTEDGGDKEMDTGSRHT
jgi:hypothetical protein